MGSPADRERARRWESGESWPADAPWLVPNAQHDSTCRMIRGRGECECFFDAEVDALAAEFEAVRAEAESDRAAVRAVVEALRKARCELAVAASYADYKTAPDVPFGLRTHARACAKALVTVNAALALATSAGLPGTDCACDGVGMCSAHVEGMVEAHPVGEAGTCETDGVGAGSDGAASRNGAETPVTQGLTGGLPRSPEPATCDGSGVVGLERAPGITSVEDCPGCPACRPANEGGSR